MKKVNQKYSYINHPDNLPLEVDGKAKKRSCSIKKQDFNGEKGQINEQEKSLIMKKMSNNIHNFQNIKSVVPVSDHRKQERKKSIKVFKQDKQNLMTSGVQYLMDKMQHIKQKDHNQKIHFQPIEQIDRKRPEKKHFIKQSIQSQKIQDKPSKLHKQTMDMKLANDIYSNAYRLQYGNVMPKRKESANLFRNGQELGLEKKRQIKLSDNKLRQLNGSQKMKMNQGGLRQRRQDWRISNINFF